MVAAAAYAALLRRLWRVCVVTRVTAGENKRVSAVIG